MHYPIDVEQANAFLHAIAPNDERFIFQTYDDKTSDDDLARVAAGSLHAVLPALQDVTHRGAAVCMQINAGVGRGRVKITAVRAVFIDLDSVESATLSEIAATMPRPSAVVASSPGKYHIYWRVLDCTLEQFKLAQLKLAAAFRSDPKVHNLDRVMRLPGTWHFKSAPIQVKLLAHAAVSYSIAALLACVTPASVAQTVSPAKSTKSRASLTDALIVAAEKFELPATLERGSRVELLVRLSGSMAAKGYSSDAICAELQRTNLQQCNPPLSDAEMQTMVYPSAHRFTAAADVQTAKTILQPSAPQEIAPASTAPDAAIDDPFDMSRGATKRATLDEFLRRYVLLEHGSEVADLECPQPHLSVLPISEWKNATANKRIGDNAISIHWLMSPHRKSVISRTYYPQHERIITINGMQFYNTFSPASITPVDVCSVERTKVFFDHIDYMFGAQSDAQQVFLNWLAVTVQRPELRIPWAPLIISAPGVGKGWLYQLMQTLLGEHNCAMIRSDDLGEKSTHNEWLSGTLLVCIDEMDSGSKWADMNRLKSILTEPYQVINKKYGAKGKERVFANFLCFTNILDAAAIRDDDRRFWVHQVPHAASPVPGYYTRLFAWLQSDGPSHLLRWLLNYDISQFDYAAPPPMTEAKRRVIQETMPPLEKLIRDAITDAIGCFRADIVSSDQIKAYVLRVLGEDKLPSTMVYPLRNAISRATSYLPQDRYTIVRNGKPTRAYLRCVRNVAAWSRVSDEAVVAEYMRSVDAEMGKASIKAIK